MRSSQSELMNEVVSFPEVPAPPVSIANMILTVSFAVGYPAVTYVTRADRCSFLHCANFVFISSIFESHCIKWGLVGTGYAVKR